MKKRGFTLIELLVVISVIALLMAILMPVLQKAKGVARGAICMNRLRQIGLAAYLYAEVYNQFVPRGTDSIQDKETWYTLLMPFLNEKPMEGKYFYNVKAFRCPSYPDKEQAICYVINGWDFKNKNDLKGGRIDEPTQMTDYKSLSTTIYMADSENGPWRLPVTEYQDPDSWWRHDVYCVEQLPVTDAVIAANWQSWTNSKTAQAPRVAHKRHRQGTNLLFADWHVGYIDAKKMTGRKSNGEFNYEAINMWRFKK